MKGIVNNNKCSLHKNLLNYLLSTKNLCADGLYGIIYKTDAGCQPERK